MSADHEGLEARLSRRYASDVYLVGAITGLLEALEELATYVNHAPTAGLLELEPRSDLVKALAQVGALRGVPVIGEVRPLSYVVSEVERVLVHENELLASAPWGRERGLGLTARLAHKLAELSAELALEARELWVQSDDALPLRREHAVGYISDASFVLLSADRCFLLAAGWSD